MALPGEIVYLARSGIAFLLIREMIRSHMILTMVSYGITNGDRRLSFCFLFFMETPIQRLYLPHTIITSETMPTGRIISRLLPSVNVRFPERSR